MAAEGKGPTRFAIEVLEDATDAAAFRLAIGAAGGSTGDVVGPASAVADRIATFDGTTGKLLKDSGTLISGLAAASRRPGPTDTLAYQPGRRGGEPHRRRRAPGTDRKSVV